MLYPLSCGYCFYIYSHVFRIDDNKKCYQPIKYVPRLRGLYLGGREVSFVVDTDQSVGLIDAPCTTQIMI
jgi:hypothetical protein